MSAIPEIANDTFVALVKDLGRGPIRGVRVLGRVDFSNAVFAERLRFRDVEFTGPVDADGARFGGGLEFFGCRFDKGVSLSSCRIDGGLSFGRCLIESGATSESGQAVGLEGAVIQGDVLFDTKTTIGDRIQADLVRVRGHFRIASSIVGMEKPRFPSSQWLGTVLALNGASIGGSVVLDATRKPGATLQSSFGGGGRPPQYFGRVELKLARIGGHLELGGAAVHGDLVASGARIGGSLFSNGSALAKWEGAFAWRSKSPVKEVAGEDPPRHQPGNTFATGGVINLDAIQVRAELDLSAIEAGLFLPEPWNATALTLTGATGAGIVVHGLVVRGNTNFESVRVKTMINAWGDAERPVDIAGWLGMNFAETVALRLINGRIGGDLILRGMRCRYRCRLGGAEDGRFVIGGGIELHSAVIGNQLSLEHAEVRGAIDLVGSRIGTCLIGTEGPVRCAGVRAVDSTWTGSVQFLDVDVSPASTADGQALSPTDMAGGSVRFEGCQFDNGLEFWMPNRWKDWTTRLNIGWTDACKSARIGGQLQIQSCRIAGDLVLTRIQVGTDEGNAPIGVIMLTGSVVTGSVMFESPVSYLTRPGLSHEEQAAAIAMIGTDAAKAFKAKSTVLLLPARARAIDLTGLELRCPQDSNDRWRGHVSGMGIEVADQVETYAEYVSAWSGQTAERRWESAVIPGALRLDFAKIGRLVVSARSFEEPKNSRPRSASDDGVVLEQATVGHLAIPRVKLERGNGFPVPLDLSGVKVSRWTFELDDDSTRGEKPEVEIASDFLDVLDNDIRLHREVYRSVYRSLKDTGFDEAADRVYVAERYRATWESEGRWYQGDGRYTTRFGRPPRLTRHIWAKPATTPSSAGFPGPSGQVGRLLWQPFRWLRLALKAGFDGLFFWFLRYGLSPLSLLIPIALLALVSFLFVAPSVRNFELSANAKLLVATGQRPGVPRLPIDVAAGISYRNGAVGATPDPTSWGGWEWAWEVARYHIPLASVAARNDYEPTDDRPLSLGLPFQDRETGEARVVLIAPWLTAEDWFQAMLLLNWMLWPVLLTFLLRKVIRTE